MFRRSVSVLDRPDASAAYTRRRRTPYRATAAMTTISQATTAIDGHLRMTVRGQDVTRTSAAVTGRSPAAARATAREVVAISVLAAGIPTVSLARASGVGAGIAVTVAGIVHRP